MTKSVVDVNILLTKWSEYVSLSVEQKGLKTIRDELRRMLSSGHAVSGRAFCVAEVDELRFILKWLDKKRGVAVAGMTTNGMVLDFRDDIIDESTATTGLIREAILELKRELSSLRSHTEALSDFHSAEYMMPNGEERIGDKNVNHRRGDFVELSFDDRLEKDPTDIPGLLFGGMLAQVAKVTRSGRVCVSVRIQVDSAGTVSEIGLSYLEGANLVNCNSAILDGQLAVNTSYPRRSVGGFASNGLLTNFLFAFRFTLSLLVWVYSAK